MRRAAPLRSRCAENFGPPEPRGGAPRPRKAGPGGMDGEVLEARSGLEGASNALS